MTSRQRPLGMLVKTFPKLSETFILEEVLGLERLGVPLRLYTLQPPSDTLTHPAVARVCSPVLRVPDPGWRHAAGFVGRHLQLTLGGPRAYARGLVAAAARGRRGLRDFARAGWLAAQLRRDGVAHLHTHFISMPADVAELAAAVGGLPYSISAHAKDIYLSEPADLARKMNGARFTVTCTEFNRATLAALAPRATVHRMYHGIDHGVFHPQCRHAEPGPLPLLLSVGRLRAKKGLDTLVDACALLQARAVPFRCEIVGYGEEQPALQARIAGQGLAGRVVLVGKLAREQVIERYAQAALYVQPSRIAADGDRDGIPNVLLEAMAMALPVVASAVSGIPELVQHGHNGLLVPPDDAPALADAMQLLLADRQAGHTLGQAARQTVTAGFDNDHNLRTLLRLLEHPHDCAAHHAAVA